MRGPRQPSLGISLVVKEVVGFGPTVFRRKDPELTEVVVNGPDDPCRVPDERTVSLITAAARAPASLAAFPKGPIYN
jgi:Flp pilus assembly CpaF family ATPase